MRLGKLVAALAAVAAVLGTAGEATGQVRVGASVGPSLLVGGASDLLDGGWGGSVSGLLGLGPAPLYLRAEVGRRGLDDRNDPLAMEVATNSLTTVLGGLELAGGPGNLELYANGLLGAAGIKGELEGAGAPPDGQGSRSWAFAYGGSAGLRLWLSGSPLALDLSGRILQVEDVTLQRLTAEGGETESGFGVIGLRGGVWIQLP